MRFVHSNLSAIGYPRTGQDPRYRLPRPPERRAVRQRTVQERRADPSPSLPRLLMAQGSEGHGVVPNLRREYLAGVGQRLTVADELDDHEYPHLRRRTGARAAP